MDPTNDLMLAPNEADPQQLLQDLLAISSAPAASRTGATASTFPSHHTPMPPPIAMPAPMPSAMPTGADPSTGGGTDWRAILRLIAPAVGSLVASGGHQAPAFWSGYQGRLAEMDQARRQQQQQAENKRKAAGDFLMQIEHGAEGYDDPTQLAQYLDAADQAGALSGFTKPGDLKNKYTVSPNKLAQKKLDELNTLLDNAEKGGYNVDDLAASGAVLTTKDGGHVPVATAIDLTRKRPLDAQGQPVSKPAKAASTEEERFLDKFAKDNGYKSAADLPSSLELQGRKLFREAGRAEPKAPPSGGVDAQFADLVELWKTGHPGQEPSAAVRTQLRKQANQVNDKPSAFGGGAPGGTGALTADGVDYAATQYRVTGTMPPLGMGNAEARAAIINRAAAQTKDVGQTPAVAIQRQAARKSDGAALTQMTKMASSAEAFETKANSQAEIIRELSAKVDRTQIPLINSAIQAGRVELLGDKNAQLLANAITTFTAEYAKLIEGSTGSAAGSSDAARKATERLISAKLNKGTLDATLSLMQREMALTRSGYDATIDSITTRMGGTPTATPAATTTTPTTPGAPIKVGGFTVVVK